MHVMKLSIVGVTVILALIVILRIANNVQATSTHRQVVAKSNTYPQRFPAI